MTIMDMLEKYTYCAECVVPREAKSDYHKFMEWCRRMDIREIGHTVAPMNDSKLRAKPLNILEFDEKTFNEGSELDGSSFATGGGRVVHRSKVMAVPDPESTWFTFPDKVRRRTLYILSEMITPEGVPMEGRKPLRLAQKVLEEALSQLAKVLKWKLLRKNEKFALLAGIEKEFFIMPADLAEKRPDIRYLGQTVVGEPGPINQILHGVYLTIPKVKEEAVLSEIVSDLASLGIITVQKHLEVGQTGNELAGRQCEIVMKHAPALQAADNELIVRQVLEDACGRHGYRFLIGSKSFTESAKGEGINGSGKHTNLSIVRYDTQSGDIIENFLSLKDLSPEDKSPVNIIGLAMLAALGRHWQVYDAAIASRGNDLRRRPGFEAPVYLSAFIGSTTEFRDSLLQDRNRSVSIGLSGNKLEWRAPGANTPMYYPLAFLHLGIVEVIREVTGKLRNSLETGKKLKDAVKDEFYRLRKEVDYFVVDEDVYELGRDEAEKRFGYKAPENTPEALQILEKRNKIEFLLKDDIFTEQMIREFRMVQLENYIVRVRAEAKVLAEMSNVLSNKVFKSAIMTIPPANLQEIEPRLKERQAHLGFLNAELLMKVDGSGFPRDKTCRSENLRFLIDDLKTRNSDEEMALSITREILPLMHEVRRIYEEIVSVIGGSEETARL